MTVEEETTVDRDGGCLRKDLMTLKKQDKKEQ
jgi:hypothetical protein